MAHRAAEMAVLSFGQRLTITLPPYFATSPHAKSPGVRFVGVESPDIENKPQGPVLMIGTNKQFH